MRRADYKLFLSTVLIIGVFFLFVSNVSAESPRGKNITEIEKVLQKIEKSKVIEPDDDAMIDKYLNEHSQNMDKELGAVKSDKNKLQKLQKEAKGHDAKLKSIQKRIDAIEKKVMNGDIKLSKGTLQKMQKSEIDEFKKSLSPNALKMYEKEYPDIFKSGTKKSQIQPESSPDNNAFCGLDIVDFFSDLFVTPAEAGYLCNQCSPLYQECLARCCSSCKWYRPGCCACKGACWTAYNNCVTICTII